MGRLLAVIGIFIAFALIVAALFAGGRSRDENTFRPRMRWRDLFGGRVDGAHDKGLAHVVRRQELADVRDAYSSAAVDPARPLYRCAGCQAFYADGSVAELARRNHHRCAICGSTDIGPVQVID